MARYQRRALVQAVAQEWALAVRDWPTDAPNVTLIERLGRCVKQPWLSSTYDPESVAFQKAILTCIQHAPTKHPEEWNR
jgi:hypothetical protein